MTKKGGGSVTTKEEYLQNPCRAASVPYWKTADISVPGNMLIVHAEDFRKELLERYMDEPYFRLKHNLEGMKRATAPKGFSIFTASAANFAAHINGCYGGTCVTEVEIQNYHSREVYCPELWLALRDDRNGKIVATGIGELDREIGEGVLEWIQVSKAYRGCGLGSYVVRELLWRMKDKAKFATVSGQCNNPAKPERLYRQCGFAGDDVWHVMRKR